MKRRKIIKIISSSILIVAISIACYYLYSPDDDDTINCTSALSIINGDEKFSFSVTFFASKGDGLMTFTGKNGDVVDNISIRKHISYTKDKNDIYIFKNSGEDIRSQIPLTDHKFDEILPPFFTRIKNEDVFIIRIIKIKHGSWLFMSTNTPYFICETPKI